MINIHIANRDRHSELALLLQSLRTQTEQRWDLVILDENETPISQNYFLSMLLNRIKLENHCVNIIRNNLRLGVCNARNKLIKEDYFKEDYFTQNEFICRLDDDCILQHDYLEKLLRVIDAGYDIASGVTPILGSPELIRNIEKIKPIVNKKEFDNEGNLIRYDDSCGFCYSTEDIIQADEFRSSALIKREIFDKIKYPNGELSFVGFREELWISVQAILAGYKIGINTQAICYHLMTPVGGCRFPDYQQKVEQDHNTTMKWLKELYIKYGDFLKEYHKNGKIQKKI